MKSEITVTSEIDNLPLALLMASKAISHWAGKEERPQGAILKHPHPEKLGHYIKTLTSRNNNLFIAWTVLVWEEDAANEPAIDPV